MYFSKLTTAVILLFIFKSITAQNGSVAGRIADPDTGERIPFATIAVYQGESAEPLTGDVSDGNGNFEIGGLPFGSYRLIVSFIGYETKEIPGIDINSQAPGATLGTIHLSQSVTGLEEVEVTAMARTSSSRIDRTTYRAADFETARGGTASDLLSRLPSVLVSPDGEVSVRGASDFLVYLNGRPTTMEPSMILSQISAGSIESVEIITVPGARFDAQGAGGIININTRRAAIEGLSVSARLQGGSAPWGELTDPYSGYEMNNDMYGGNLDLLYHSDRVTLYSNLYYNKRNTNGIRNGNASILQPTGENYTLHGTGARPELHENISVNGGLVLDISEQSSLDLSYFFANRTETRGAYYLYRGEGLTDPPPYAGNTDYWTFNPNVGDRLGIIHNITAQYSFEPDEYSELGIMAAYERTELRRDLSNPNYSYDEAADIITSIQRHFMQSDDTPLDGFRLNIDYQRELNNGHSIGAGFQPQYLNNRGSFSYDTLNVVQNIWGSFSSLENDFDLKRGIYAAYLNYSGNAGNLGFMAGLRMEYTDQVMDIENPDYFSLFDRETKPRYTLERANLFPSLHLSYPVFDNDELTMAASRRINRPQTQNMAPFLYRRHHEVYEVGDPALEPEYLNNLEVSYLKRAGNQNIRLTGFYRGTNNAVFRIYTVYDEENILIRSFTNAGTSTALGAELNTDLSIGRIARIYLGGSLYNFNVSGEFFGYMEDNSSTNWTLNGNVNIFLNRSLRLVVDFDWRSATVTAQGSEDMFFVTGAALNYIPPRWQAWNFTIRALDILGTNVTNWSTRAYDSSGRQIFFKETDYDRYGPVAELSVTYSFNLNGRTLRRDVDTFGDEQF
ncbi:MAG: TonB-dependent receptor [Marinilabiliales bacterium]|nr:MAG: TonB-dependent receptor [Marinilabiliales bacterium]